MGLVTRLVPGLALLLGGCVTQQTTVLEQSQQAMAAGVSPRPRPAAAAARGMPPAQCLPPRGTGPFTPMPHLINVVHYIKPARAAADHVAGCASVRFRVAADGVPINIEVLADYPPGYGIADSLSAAIAAARFEPTNDLSWHFRSLTFRGDQ